MWTMSTNEFTGQASGGLEKFKTCFNSNLEILKGNRQSLCSMYVDTYIEIYIVCCCGSDLTIRIRIHQQTA